MKTITLFVILLTIFITLVKTDLYSAECDIVSLPENTIIISEDTFLQCTGASNHYLICSGATVTFTDNSCFSTFYLESGSNLIITEGSHGYSNVYVPNGASFDANSSTYMNLYFESDAVLQDTAFGSGWVATYTECDDIIYDYSLSGSCNESDPDCDDILLPAETIIVSSDTSIVCAGFDTHFLICAGVTAQFADNSCFNTFYLEPGASLELSGYGYSTVYAREGSYFDANFLNFQYLYFETNANIYDTASPNSPFNIHECDNMNFDYSLSGSCNDPISDCDEIILPAETIIVSSDTSIVCAGFDTHFLICAGVTAQFADNSCFNTFYLEPGASLELSGYGYSTVYAREGSYFDANFIYFQFLHFEPNANIYDTASPGSPFNVHECNNMIFDYSLSGSCTSTIVENSVLETLEYYPNPAKDNLYFNSDKENIDLKIYNYLGMLVLERNLIEGQSAISISDLSQGIYLMILTHNNETRIEKLVIE
jgi:hypothetical protein